MNSSYRTTYNVVSELQKTSDGMRPAAFSSSPNCPNKVMKTILHSFLLLLVIAPVSRAAQQAVPPRVAAAEQAVLARVTVYWASGGGGSDYWTRRHIGASGARLRPGHCAVYPRRIPYGSKVTLPDGTLLAVDTGGAVRSRKAARLSGRTAMERNAIVIDRFFETKQQALSWARRNPYFMFVRISPPSLRSGPLFTQPQKVAQAVMPVVQKSAAPQSLQPRPKRRAGWMP